MHIYRLLFFFVALSCANRLTALPYPYNEVKELKSFVDHGWYQNSVQLHDLLNRYQVKTIVEIGSWLGQSTIDLARTLPKEGKIYAIDHWMGSAEHQAGQAAWHPCLPFLYEQFLSNIIHAGLTDKVIPLKMNSLEAARILNVAPDLVYLDADHGTEAVYLDLHTWYPFVKGRGILCGDDWRWASVRAAVEQFAGENGLMIEASGNFWRLVE